MSQSTARVARAEDYAFRLRDGLLGAQMLCVAFGSLVLVPLLTGLDANVALFTAGIGTLIFQFTTKRSVPVFLASSFAFIAPIAPLAPSSPPSSAKPSVITSSSDFFLFGS